MDNQRIIISMRQVHGNNVVRVYKKDFGKIIQNCDGIVTNDPDITLAVRTADCLPISIIDNKNKAIGLIHAGWRGLQKEIIKNAISLMVKEFGSAPSNLKIEIGPHICKKHYETDLIYVAKKQLKDLGVLVTSVKVDSRCTFEDIKLPSYRRDKTYLRHITFLTIDT